MEDTYLRRSEAAKYLQERVGAYTTETLAKMAVEGSGPPYRLLGRFPVYLERDLESWVASRMSPPVRSSSELSALAQAGG